MSAIQLDPMPVVTPLGKGYAVIFEAGPHDNYWTVILEDGAIVTFTQEKIRAARSYTHHRISDDGMREILERARNDGDHPRSVRGETAASVGVGVRAAGISRKPA